MATKIESTEVIQQKKVIVESKAVLDEMKQNGQLEPFTEYYTKEKSETPFMPVGSIFMSAIPQTDARIHLLDGSTILQTGVYAKFSNLIKALVSTGNAISCTQAEFDADVLATGNCGKFVIDNDAGTIRLPKITTFIQGLSDISNIGSSLSAGLPNITGSIGAADGGGSNQFLLAHSAMLTGAFKNDTNSGSMYYSNDKSIATDNNGWSTKAKFDASLSNNLYGNSETVQPNATQYPYYIVLASGYKSSEVIDIDNIMNDVNSKLSKYDLYLKYPVGSLYISTNPTSPADAVANGGLGGGVWEQLPEGLALWTTTTEGEGGNTIEAGLPNITGSFAVYTYSNGAPSGAFSSTTNNTSQVGGSSSGRNYVGVSLNASKSNSIYGSSTTVQPPAYKVYAWKRVG